APLLALEHVRDGLERAVAGTRDRAAAAAVVEQRVDGLLEHPLLVVHDDLGRTEVEQTLEPVVPVDHAAVQVVEVRRGEPAAVELDHRAQVRRDDRDRVEDHALGRVRRRQERVDDLEALEGTRLALALAVLDDLAQRRGLGLEVEVLEALLDRGRAHGALEVVAVPVLQGAVEHLVALEVRDLEVLEAVPDLLETVDLGVRTLADLVHLALGRVTHLAARVGLGTLGLELGEVLLEALRARLDVGVTPLGDLLLLQVDLVLEVGQVLGAALLVDLGDHVGGEVDDLLQVLRRQVEQVPQARGHALEEPDVGDRGGELDVAHPLTAHLGARHLDAAALADDALEADALVLAAVALPVPGGAEDLLAEEAVLLGLEGAVVDGLGLLDLAVRPCADVLRGRQTDTQLVEDVDVEQGSYFLRLSVLTRRGSPRRWLECFRWADVPVAGTQCTVVQQ